MDKLEYFIMNPIINEFGTKKWFNDKGELHRVDGPAVEYPEGSKSWYIHGEYIHCNNNEEFLRIVKMKALL
jgi:hypothetical protein